MKISGFRQNPNTLQRTFRDTFRQCREPPFPATRRLSPRRAFPGVRPFARGGGLLLRCAAPGLRRAVCTRLCQRTSRQSRRPPSRLRTQRAEFYNNRPAQRKPKNTPIPEISGIGVEKRKLKVPEPEYGGKPPKAQAWTLNKITVRMKSLLGVHRGWKRDYGAYEIKVEGMGGHGAGAADFRHPQNRKNARNNFRGGDFYLDLRAAIRYFCGKQNRVPDRQPGRQTGGESHERV